MVDVERGALPGSFEGSVFDRGTTELHLGILRALGNGADGADGADGANGADGADGERISSALERLAATLGARLDELARRAERGGDAALQALSLAKRVAFEVVYPLARAADLSGAARDAVGQLLGRACLFERVPHPRYHITQDWFSHNIPSWQEVLAPLRGEPGVRCLEIGSFEGLSACWLLDNILTHETSRIVCVDPFESPGQLQAERHFDHNVRQTGAGHKVTKLKGTSHQALPLLSGALFDLAYIDGSHHPADALKDALSVWPLLRRGGLAIFDDYAIGGSYPAEIAASIDPRPGIDAFLGFARGEHEIVAQGYQLVVRKT
ncbi:class I SAM-dependent methyltransferase [Sorangium sp. So ce131]|uniref:class I SAM-dependent methyltransferase n=1 Tax=Sorangium sp. So ce131 TaxID=3133282 RepID=UPI003F608D07